MKIHPLLFLLPFLSGCSATVKDEYTYTSERLKINPINENVYMHVSYLYTNDFGKVDCNGMIYLNEGEAIVFDTPTNDSASAELIHWIETQKDTKITAVVVTHFHNDCLGGLKQFHEKNIPSFASEKTINLAKTNNLTVLPETGFETKVEFRVGSQPVYAMFYGAGHTQDNIVGYIPKEDALFGGCLIKTMNASKGFLGDADTLAWSNTVGSIKAELPGLKVVIPGHGNPGGKELLDYTIQLFQNR